MIVAEVSAIGVFRGAYSEVKSFTLPEKGEVNKPVEFEIVGHLSKSVRWPNFAIALWYRSGPTDKVTVTMDGVPYELPLGSILYTRTTYRPDPCFNLKATYSITFEEKGDYSFAALTGYFDVDEGRFYYDDRVDKTVKIAEVAPPLPWWEQPILGVPAWIWIAGGGGAAVILTVAGVIAYQERQREETLLMLMAMRR